MPFLPRPAVEGSLRSGFQRPGGAAGFGEPASRLSWSRSAGLSDFSTAGFSSQVNRTWSMVEQSKTLRAVTEVVRKLR